MSIWLLVAIIVFVIAFILSNIMLLKKSANQQFSSSLTEANKNRAKNSDSDKED